MKEAYLLGDCER